MKIKVLITVGSLSMGGNEVFVMNLIRNIDYSKFDLDLLVFSKDNVNEDFVEEIQNSKCRLFFSKETNRYRQFWTNRKFIIKGNYDIIHANSCSFVGLYTALLPSIFVKNIKRISHSHNSGTPTEKLSDQFIRKILKQMLCRMVDMGFSCSDIAGKSKYTNEFMISDRYVQINNAIDVSKFQYNEEKRRKYRDFLGIGEDEIVIGNVGRLDEQKNQQFLIKIFERYSKSNKARLIIIGDGYKKDELVLLAKDLNVQDKILFLGNQKDVSVYYNVMDYLVMPSLYEGFPFVLVEAQVNGLHCIISDSISQNVNLSKDVTFLSLKSEPERWCEEINKISPQRVSNKQVKNIMDRFDIKNEIKKVEKIYTNLVIQEK